jgi:hypothetical protein
MAPHSRLGHQEKIVIFVSMKQWVQDFSDKIIQVADLRLEDQLCESF